MAPGGYSDVGTEGVGEEGAQAAQGAPGIPGGGGAVGIGIGPGAGAGDARDTSYPAFLRAAMRCMVAGMAEAQGEDRSGAAVPRCAYTASDVSMDRLHAHMAALEEPGV